MARTDALIPAEVGPRAAQILDRVALSPEYDRLMHATRRHAYRWTTFTGFPSVADWDVRRDASALIAEAVRALALITAAFQLARGDAWPADMAIPAPVEGTVHAVLAQSLLCSRIGRRLGIDLVNITGARPPYGAGDRTYTCYAEWGWGVPNPRFWLDPVGSRHRLRVLGERYRSIGVHGGGNRHDIDFTRQEAYR